MSYNINAKINYILAQTELIIKDVSQKQPVLKQSSSGDGVLVIDSDNNVRQIITYYPLMSQVYNNLQNASDNKNNNIQITFAKDFSNLTHYYTSIESDTKYMPLFTIESPLNLQNQILSIDLNSYATTYYVDSIINNLLSGVGPSLNTLNELALALNNDSQFASTVTNMISNLSSIKQNTLTAMAVIDNQ